jgi:saccharopine dehydrogenase-like NADP-dependent oxidoreductase
VRSYIFKTLRYPGHHEKILAIKELGLLDEKPAVGQRPNGVAAKTVFLAVAQPRSGTPRDPRHRYRARRRSAANNRAGLVERTYDVLEYEDGATGFSALQRVAGFSAAAAMSLLVTEAVRARGVAPLERSFLRHALFGVRPKTRSCACASFQSSPDSDSNGLSLKNDSGIQ